MDFQLSEDFVKENGLTEDQVKAVSTFVASDYIPNIKKAWDGKANENAEGILTGVAKSILESNKLEIEREKGEKWNDYINRLSEAKFANDKTALEGRQKEIDEKLKNFKGSDDLKSALEAEKLKNDTLLKQVAELEPLKGFDEKYNQATEQLKGLKKEVAYSSVKPNFPEEVNKYEADTKWSDFKKSIEAIYDLELIEDKPWAIDKENPHKKVRLSELVEQDNNIKELLQGRQQGGTGAKPESLVDVEGVPFKVPQNATSEERSKLIREYLASKGIQATDPQYAKNFSELNLKIAKAKQAA